MFESEEKDPQEIALKQAEVDKLINSSDAQNSASNDTEDKIRQLREKAKAVEEKMKLINLLTK